MNTIVTVIHNSFVQLHEVTVDFMHYISKLSIITEMLSWKLSIRLWVLITSLVESNTIKYEKRPN